MFPDNSWWEVTDCNIFMSLFAGKDVYTLVTGDETAFEQLFDALPNAINDIKKSKHILTPKDQVVFEKYKQLIFKD